MARSSFRSSREKWMVGFCLSVCIIAVIVHFLNRPLSLPDIARKVDHATFAGDGNALLPWIWEEEREANGLDAHKVTLIYQKLILPRMAKYGYQDSSLILQDNGHQVEMGRPPSKSFGTSQMWSRVVNARNGSGRFMVGDDLIKAWIVEGGAVGKGARSREYRQAMLAGMAKDRAVLQEIGWDSRCSADFMKGEIECTPLDVVAARLRKLIDEDRG